MATAPFYIIESGDVEIIRESPGTPDEQLSIPSARDSFGELALLQNIPRTATVRCLTPVNVIYFCHRDFLQLMGSYQIFQTHMKGELALLERQEKNRMMSSTLSMKKQINLDGIAEG
jgi:CRP-like cAMP-binding protein